MDKVECYDISRVKVSIVESSCLIDLQDSFSQ